MADMNDIMAESTRFVSACYGHPISNDMSVFCYGQQKLVSSAKPS